MSKAKNKKPGKSGRLESRNPDLSELRKPIKISVSSLKEVAKLLETGTPEIKELLTYEVNLLYECRICRSIFRSLLNFLCHKRVFCREKFNASYENKSRDDHTNSTNCTAEDIQGLELDQITLDNLINPSKNDRILRSQAPNKATKKDLTSVIDMLQKKQVENVLESPDSTENQLNRTDCDQVVLQVLDSKRAAYQTLVEPNLSPDDLMENQVIELDNILSQETVVLGADGQIEKSDSPVHFYSNEEPKQLACDFCPETFITQKTLRSHIKIKHAPVRDCYFCPCNSCTASFANFSNAKRHLTSVHRKIGPELDSLSQKIERRTVRSKPVTIVNKKPKKPEVIENTSYKSQEWRERLLRPSDQLECRSCGLKFEEKSQLLIHLKNCLRENVDRINDTFENVTEVEENSVRESSDDNVQNISSDDQQQFMSEETPENSFEKVDESNCLAITGVSSLSEEVWSKLPTSCDRITDFELFQKMLLNLKRPIGSSISETTIVGCPSFTFKPVDNPRKRKFSVNEVSEISETTVQGDKIKKISSQEHTVDKLDSRKTNSQLFSEAIASLADHTKLECIPCRRSFSNITGLNRHMENHIKINRFRCNKCDFKSVNRSDCVGHCNKMHNAMNNRQVLNEMISQIPHDEMTLSQEMITVGPPNLIPLRVPNTDHRFGNCQSTTNVLPNNHNIVTTPISKTISQPAANTESDEIIIETISTPPSSNVTIPSTNRILHLQNQKNNEIIGYSPALCDLDFDHYSPDEDNEVTQVFYRSNLSKNSKRSNSRNSTRSRGSARSSSRDSISSEMRRTTRSSSRLSKKLHSDCEDDELFEALSPTQGRKSKNGRRTSSRASKRSSSRNEGQNESGVVTRSRSRLGNQISKSDEDNENSFLVKDSGSEKKAQRSKSSLKKQVEETGKRGRGRPRKRCSLPEKINVNDSDKGVQRRESFSSESSQSHRPIRNRIKHVEKDFIYDLEDNAFGQSTPAFVNSSPGKNRSINDRTNAVSSNGTQFGADSDDDLVLVGEVFGTNSNSELEEAELFFKGFPPQIEVLNND